MRRSAPTYGLYGESNAQRPDFWLHWETIASRSQLHNWEIKPHKHDAFLQILYLRGGTGDAVFNGEVHAILPPVMIAIPAKYAHGFRFSKDMDGVVITMAASRFGALGRSFVDAEIGKWFSTPHLVLLHQTEGDRGFLAQTLEKLCQELMQGGLFHADLVEVHLRTAMLMAARITAAGQPEFNAGVEINARMKALDALVNRHLRDHHPAEFYAGHLGISVTHLNRIVKAATGQSTNALVASRLIDQAKRDLVFTTTHIKQIAYDLGFNDPAYFSRFFTRQTGSTPRQYRAEQHAKLTA
ncbi:AraC family transcriptional regulator [Phyllobacterium brassicacearum]|uniref:AraC family transcriptional regulator n=1 Tax=Phyllobacterium brassicacearum TaxID=314235 RepID=A0A2P7BQN0_9HYPH|nr:helix-turn-helix domain-containing protein [Phyllobacterium brassicacearum]PSH68770.1 AraC family transcriptional regulator [Phyllobacterium brassicacearum]TDQ33498.1 AraC family transcriptional activator of pobA [Phyllobacterium brassicacearum]